MLISGLIIFIALTGYMVWKRLNADNLCKLPWIKFFSYIYAALSIFFLLCVISIFFSSKIKNPQYIACFYIIFGILITVYIPNAIYLFITIIPVPKKIIIYKRIIGILAALIAAFLFIKGMCYDRKDFRVETIDIVTDKIPESFKGYRIALISDLHLGSWRQETDPIRTITKLINQESPDIILFAGDMVNNFAEEIDPYIEILSELKARDGIFAVTGNHDYGWYYDWNTLTEHKKNFNNICSKIHKAGFRLLMNEHLHIKRGQDSIILAGMENFSLLPRPMEGDFSKAIAGIDTSLFTILMSHDPVFFEKSDKTDGFYPDLTLSGHTHGGQCSFKIGKFEWSPFSILRRYNSGLYYEGDKALFVTRGVGYIGFPGRIGSKPQIAILELKTTM